MAKDNAISRYYSKNVTPVHSVAERMKQRREFVMGKETAPSKSVGGGSPTPQVSPNTVPGSINDVLSQLLNPANATYYNDRVGQANNQTQAAYNSANDMVKNGIDGTAINPVPLGNNVASFYGANADRMDSLLNNLISGQVAQKNANTGQYSAVGDIAAKKAAQNTADFQAGYGGNGAPGAGDTGGTGSGYTPQAVQALINSGAGDLFKGGTTGPTAIQTYKDIMNAGGLAAYRKQNPASIPSDLSQTLGATNDTLKKINYITEQLSDPNSHLKQVLDNPINHALLMSNNPYIDSSILKLNPKDKQALAYMTSLNATNDRSSVGGRLDNYLLQQIGPSSVGRGQKSDTNLEMLNNAKQMIKENLMSTYGQKYGYKSVYDIPGFQLVEMKAPNGQIHEFDKQYAQQALKNGYKEVE